MRRAKKVNWQNRIVGGLVVLVVVILISNFVRGHYAHTEAKAAQARSAAAAVAAKIAVAQTAKTDYARNQRELSRLRAELPTSADISGVVADLARIAAGAGVRLTSTSPGTPVAGNGVSTIPISVAVAGPQAAVGAFLTKIESAPRLFGVSDVSDTWNGSAINSSLQLSVYTDSGAASGGPLGSVPGGQPGAAPGVASPGTVAP